MRIGLREVLNDLPGLSVVTEAARLEDMVAGEVDVFVVVSPVTFEHFENFEAILLLTDEPTDAQELIDLEIPTWGVLSVNASEDELKTAISALAEGLWVCTPALARDLLTRNPARNNQEDEQAIESLTERETQVLQLTAQGLANKQIALQLGISEHTVKFHLSALYAKLGVTSRTEAVRSGARRGLVVL